MDAAEETYSRVLATWRAVEDTKRMCARSREVIQRSRELLVELDRLQDRLRKSLPAAQAPNASP